MAWPLTRAWRRTACAPGFTGSESGPALKKFVAPLLALALTASDACAGGPVVVAEEPVADAASPRSGWIVPVIVGLVVLCAVACGNDDETVPPPP